MSRFVPLRIQDFKRLAGKLKEPHQLKHSRALELLAKASGFEHFFHVSRIHADGRPMPVPTALQCAGDVGFDVWHGQLMAALDAAGAPLETLDIEEMRKWYRYIFVPGDPSTTPPPIAPGLAVQPADVDDGERGVISAAPVVVTYRRRRVLEKH